MRAPLARSSCCRDFGGLAEWSKAAVLKTVEGKPSVGSNPTPTAIILVSQPSINASLKALFVAFKAVNFEYTETL